MQRAVVMVLMVMVSMASLAGAEQFAKVGSFGGQFARIPVDARGEAMGLATTVNPQGPLAFWWNPAPLPESDRVEVSYTIRDYAADLEWRPLAVRMSKGNLTFGVTWCHLGSDPMLVRTAYEPDGNGETFDFGNDLVLISGAVDLMPWLAGGPSPWAWSVGANTRFVREKLAESTASAMDGDLGTTLARTLADDEGLRLRVMGTAMVRNVMASSMDYEEVTGQLPRYYHFGLGFDAGFGGHWRGQPLFVMTMAHTWRRFLENEFYGVDSDHFGLELLVGGMMSLRLGDRDPMVFLTEGRSWGVGLQWRFEPWHDVRAAVDYARTDLVDNDIYADDAFDHWTFTLGVDLP